MDVIRLATERDAPAIADLYRPYVGESRVSFEESAPDAAEMARRVCGNFPGMHPWLVAEEDSRLLGFANSSPFRARKAYRWSVETGIYLAEDACGRGLGRSLLETLLSLLTRQGYVAAIGAVSLPNEPSIRLHQALGFRHAGTYRGAGFKLGDWIDVDLWQKDLAPRSTAPAEPLAVADVITPTEFAHSAHQAED